MRSISLSPFISTPPLHYNSHKSFDSHNPFNPPSSSFSTSTYSPTMSINLQSHAFAGNPIKLKTPKPEHPFSPSSSLESLNSQLFDNTQLPSSINFKVLPFRKGRPLATSSARPNDSPSTWHLGWIDLADFKSLFANSTVELTGDLFVYLGSLDEENAVYWAIDVSSEDGLVSEFASKLFCFVEVRTLMVAADWADARTMGELAIAGHARALLEWHNVSKFCGHCGGKTVPVEAGKRKQCSNPLCKKKVYPRVDPVVIMLVIDRENDRALLSKQSRFVPRMWSCLAGFIEPGESLEEAVKRETWEETGIEVGEVVYHSSQPWPVGPSNMPCQLMVGFFAYAKSFDINVDKGELEDAQWHSREDVRNALTFAEYEKAQRTAAAKVEQMCKGVERQQSLSSDFNVESGELAPMFVPGPFAIAHHLISSWVYNEGSELNKEMIPRKLRTVFTGAAVILGGICTLNFASFLTIQTLRLTAEAKRRKIALPCKACRGKGFYICKLCRGNAVIQWSPLSDPIAMNPCVCPTCDGNRVQRCLNCLGKGYEV